MSYERLNLKNKDKFTAEHLAHLEDGIATPTHWLDIVDNALISKYELVEAFPETVIEYNADQDGYMLTSPPKLMMGQYYTIIYDGQKWEHLPVQSYMGMMFAITNPGIDLATLFETGDETNLLFALLEFAGETGFLVNTEEPAETVTLQLFQEVITPRKLGPEHLPPGVPYSDGNPNHKIDILPESTLVRQYTDNNELTVHGISSSLAAIELGQTYDVYYNGQCYQSEAYIASDEEPYIVLGDMGALFPFLVIVVPDTLGVPFEGLVYAWDCAEQVTLAITSGEGAVQQLPYECLPGGVPVYHEGVNKRTLVSDTELTRTGDDDGSFLMGRLNLQPSVEYELIINGMSYTSICFESHDGSGGEVTARILGMDNSSCPAYVIQYIEDLIPDYVNTIVVWRAALGTTITMSLNECMPYTILTPLDQRCFPTDLSVIHLLSPSGKKFAISVSDDGNLSATEVI